MDTRPLIGITMGDPSGVGPEIIAKVIQEEGIYRICKPVILGDLQVLSHYIDSSIIIKEISTPDEARGHKGTIDVIKISSLESIDFIPGKPTPASGRAMVDYILTAVDMTMKGKLSAMVTCPINKALMYRAGYNFEGHTELLAHLTHTNEFVMMLAGDKLRVTLVTIHCALKDVPEKLSIENILSTISITAQSLKKDFGICSPRIAVAALNPHAGEEGLFGTEEITLISPAIKKALDMGYNVTGPLPADTLYPKAVNGLYDAVVNMYHDQGLIPLKLIHFADGVNVTLGLPIIRTSVDHGTAYDIAGKGIADHRSLLAAIRMAGQMAQNRRMYSGLK